MRKTTLVACLAVVALAGKIMARTQSSVPVSGTLFMHTPHGATVSISKNGVVLTSLTIASGATISAYDEHHKPIASAPGRYEFHGAFELRIVGPETPRGAGHIIMAQAPIVLTGQGVDVVLGE
jgi:hypothetical protein